MQNEAIEIEENKDVEYIVFVHKSRSSARWQIDRHKELAEKFGAGVQMREEIFYEHSCMEDSGA
jgi:ADP-heptose:LPS heptosyltransferase